MIVAGYPSIPSSGMSRLGLAQLGVSRDVEIACDALLTKDSGARLPGVTISSYKQRIAAATKLAILKDPDGIDCLLTAAIFDSDATIRRTCVAALGYAVGNDSVVWQLLLRLQPVIGEPEAVVRKTILETLHKIITLDNAFEIRQRASQLLVDTWNNDSDESVRELAKQVALDLGGKGTIPPIPTDENGEEKDDQQKKAASGLSTAAKVGIGLGVFGALGAIIAVAAMKD